MKTAPSRSNFDFCWIICCPPSSKVSYIRHQALPKHIAHTSSIAAHPQVRKPSIEVIIILINVASWSARCWILTSRDEPVCSADHGSLWIQEKATGSVCSYPAGPVSVDAASHVTKSQALRSCCQLESKGLVPAMSAWLLFTTIL